MLVLLRNCCLGLALSTLFTELKAATINFSASSTVTRAPVKLEIASSPATAIRFTRDGSEPTARSEIYKDPLVISNTSIIRASTFEGSSSGTVGTRSFIFPEQVIHQTGAAFPDNWGTKDGKEVRAAYGLSQEIITTPAYRDSAAQSLEALPSLSIVMPVEDLFGKNRGIYTHPEESGDEWERRCSLELITAGQSNVQVICGIRIQGGWNRRPEESPKHSFRVVFKKKYGAGKLHAPIFGKDGPKEFDSLILRSGCNNSWLHWSGVERRRGELIRDQWVRDTMREMGQPSAAGIFVHLYLNGLYWGIYNLTERPDAAFAASHLGGMPRDYDAFNAEKLIEGTRDAWTDLMNRINKVGKGRAEYLSVAEMLDVQSFADYMILNLYGANADWDRHSNWYAARRHTPPGKFRFFIWDAERTLEDPLDTTIDFKDDESPPGIFHRLLENPEFRTLFAARAKHHLQSNGALTPKRCAERYKKWSNELDLAIIAESARWGGYRRDVHQYKEGPYELYTRDTHWRPEVDRLLNNYFPKRTAVVLDQFRQKSLLQ